MEEKRWKLCLHFPTLKKLLLSYFVQFCLFSTFNVSLAILLRFTRDLRQHFVMILNEKFPSFSTAQTSTLKISSHDLVVSSSSPSFKLLYFHIWAVFFCFGFVSLETKKTFILSIRSQKLVKAIFTHEIIVIKSN